jgi:hypothetical protein
MTQDLDQGWRFDAVCIAARLKAGAIDVQHRIGAIVRSHAGIARGDGAGPVAGCWGDKLHHQRIVGGSPGFDSVIKLDEGGRVAGASADAHTGRCNRARL